VSTAPRCSTWIEHEASGAGTNQIISALRPVRASRRTAPARASGCRYLPRGPASATCSPRSEADPQAGPHTVHLQEGHGARFGEEDTRPRAAPSTKKSSEAASLRDAAPWRNESRGRCRRRERAAGPDRGSAREQSTRWGPHLVSTPTGYPGVAWEATGATTSWLKQTALRPARLTVPSLLLRF